MKLESIAARVFCDDRCLMSFAGSDNDYDRFWKAAPECGRVNNAPQALVVPEPTVKREAFIVPSDVSFTALGWDRRLIDSSAPITGTWSVAARALSYDYLWNEVRVKGGAYGTGFQVLRSGSMRFYSYRDPHLDETLERFAQTSDWFGSFDPSPIDLEGFIVASVAKIDAPIKPRQLVRRQMSDFFTGQTPEERATRRREVIEATASDIRGLADTLSRVVEQRSVCTFGNRTIRENAKEDLTIIPLVG